MRAAIYSRISADAEQTGQGVARQLADARALCAARGYSVAQEYSDNDVSAAGRAKQRPEYAAMLAAAAAGEFEVIVAYSNSRLTRRPRELEDLIDLYANHGIAIVTVVSGEDDLSTADGRMVARLKGSIDSAEAERVAERLTRQKAQRAADGKPQGGRYRVYGYTRDFDIIDSEAAIVREVFERKAKGESNKSIGTDLGGRGVVTSSGAAFKSTTIAHMLAKPGYAGKREYKGQIIGDTSYPSLISLSLYDAAQRPSKANNTRKHLLSGILRCSKCLSAMTGKNPTANKSHKRNAYYKCAEAYGGCGNVSIQMPLLDEAVFNAAYKKYQDIYFSSSNASTGPSRDYAAEVTTLQNRIKETQAAYTNGVMNLVDVTAILNTLRDDIKKIEQAQASDVTKDLGVMEPLGANLSQERAFISTYITNVVIGPWDRSQPNAWQERVRIEYADGSIGGIETGKVLDVLKNAEKS